MHCGNCACSDVDDNGAIAPGMHSCMPYWTTFHSQFSANYLNDIAVLEAIDES